MDYPERFSNLPAYAFPRLRSLLDPVEPGDEPLAMTIGEPQHPFPAWVGDVLSDNLAGFGNYPPNDGAPELLAAITGWLQRRYSVTIKPDRVMALNGTREGLYNAAMALCPETKTGQRPVILSPNPFYQVYAVAALSVGAEPVFVPATADSGHLPDFAGLDPKRSTAPPSPISAAPPIPQGAVASREYWAELLALAEKHDFRVFADECYSEIYRDAPPPGILEAVADTGTDPERAVVFHSLSKRSNLPGLRSGFVASGPENIRRIRQLRAYAGAPLPLPLQRVAERVWSDEAHVEENRALYREKYALADEILGDVPGYTGPEAGFFLWLPVADSEAAALKLWSETGRARPARQVSQPPGPRGRPGRWFIRVAMVAPKHDVQRGLTRIRACLYDRA